MVTDFPVSGGLSIAVPFNLARAVFASGASQDAAGERRQLSRDAAIYLSHIAFSQSVPALARAFARSPRTVRRACARIEDLRDAPVMDRAFACLEGAASAYVRCLGEA